MTGIPDNRPIWFASELDVLVVDDRPDDSRLVKLDLERTGAVVKECLCAAEALETLVEAG